MDNSRIASLLEQRRDALIEYCIGNLRKGRPEDKDDEFTFVRSPGDLSELLRMDPLDNYAVQSSWVAEAVSCAQNYIHAAYRKLELGYSKIEFDKRHLEQWRQSGNYPDWSALQMVALYPENYINPFVRLRKTSLFKTLENDLNQTRLNTDSVQVALRQYLQVFERTCNLDVISVYMDGTSPSAPLSPARANYFFVGRQRVQPFQYFWRKAEVELSPSCRGINPAVWSEWQSVEVPAGETVLDMRATFWGGRLCLVWAEWRAKEESDTAGGMPNRLEVKLAFMALNGHWSPPFLLHASEPAEDVSKGCRLVVTAFVDNQHPKGKLGVLLTNRGANANRVDVFVVRDVLFRSVVHDDGTWLARLADHRFTDASIVQHPILPGALVIDQSVETAGSLGEYYALGAFVIRQGGYDYLMVSGSCAIRPGVVVSQKNFDLTILDPAGEDPAPLKGVFSNAGGWNTPWMILRREAGGFTKIASFSFGGTTPSDGLGRNKFVVTVGAVASFTPPSLDKTNTDGAQFLALNQDNLILKFARLNSLFGPDLVQRANISVDAVLDWSTQFLVEPGPATGEVDEPNGSFNGANGLFFWELFFHLPHLIASRLSDENRFAEAQQWLHYLFDPQAIADPSPTTPNSKVDYWRCRPLTGKGNLGCEAEAPTDPDAIGYSNPKHLQIVAFIEYVKNLMNWGDWYYRQLTRDSFAAARLCYVQAGFLMGKAPTARTVNSWEPATVAQLLDRTDSRPALEEFEKNLLFTLADIPAKADQVPDLGMLAVEGFKLPINEELMAWFALPEQRLNNLRNNLTLDGRPLQTPLFSPATDPNQLLSDLAAGGAGSPRPMGGQLVVVAFRWRVMFEAALRAAQTLQEFGSQILRLIEQFERAEMEELQSENLVALGDYAVTVQEQSILQLEATLAALGQSRAVAQERMEEYAKKYESNVSEAEYEVMDHLLEAKIISIASSAHRGAGAFMKALIPNQAGTSWGVANPGAIVDVVGTGLEIAATGLIMHSDRMALTETYRRRREEWRLQRDQAQAEVRATSEQITAQHHAVEAAEASLRQTVRANAQALTLYKYLKKRATNAELFGWLLGQLKALHYQAYDHVVSLCISAQGSLSAQTADYDSPTPLPQIWLNNRHGLMAGEHLRLHLQRMERDYLQRYERRLELVKTISLRQLFNDTVEPQTGFKNWQTALKNLIDTGTLEFQLTQLLFDRDHPGHYRRQISSVEIDLPALVGPYEDVKAIFLQTQSITATQPTIRSVEYLHKPANAVAPSEVRFNLRAGQQIAVSSGVSDTGMVTVKPDEGLLNPFEYTGVISRWLLSFPRYGRSSQNAMLVSLTDIILRLRYTAKAGDPTFARRVEELVQRLDPDEEPKLD